MTSYSRGYYGEKKARRQLEDDGYFVVEARGSHGVADLVAIKPGQILVVQVKRTTSGRLDPLERQQLWELARWIWAEPIAAFQPKARGPMALTGVGVGDFEDFLLDEVGAA
jgi:Holliday junction resolvase